MSNKRDKNGEMGGEWASAGAELLGMPSNPPEAPAPPVPPEAMAPPDPSIAMTPTMEQDVIPIVQQQPRTRGPNKSTPAAQAAVQAQQQPKPPPPPSHQWRKTGFFKNALDAYAPNAEQMKVWHRSERTGANDFIKTFSMSDLGRANDLEQFIANYLVPKYGAGEYSVQLFAANGTFSNVFLYNFAPPEGLAASAPAKDPIVERLLDRIDSLTSKGQGDSAQAMLIAEMRADLRSLREPRNVLQPGPIAPPFPADPPMDIKGVLEAALNAAKPQLTIQDMLALVHAQQPKTEAFGVKDMIALVPVIQSLLTSITSPLKDAIDGLGAVVDEMKRDSGKAPSFKQQLEDLAALQEVARKNNPFPEGNPDSFVGFLREILADFPTKIEAIGDLVASIRAKDRASNEAPALPPGPEQIEVKPVAPAAPKAPPVDPFPAGTEELVKQIAAAPDDAGRIGATITLFLKLATRDPWRPHMLGLVELAKASDKAKALEIMSATLNGFNANKRFRALLPKSAVTATMAAFEANADQVLEKLKKFS